MVKEKQLNILRGVLSAIDIFLSEPSIRNVKPIGEALAFRGQISCIEDLVRGHRESIPRCESCPIRWPGELCGIVHGGLPARSSSWQV